MDIRSTTFFLNPTWPLDLALLEQAGQAAQQAVAAYQQAGYTVQTIRMATPPFPQVFAGLTDDEIIKAVQTLEQTASQAGFNYIAIGPAGFDNLEDYALVPKIIGATENVFCSAYMASPEVGVSIPAVRACAEIITQLAPQDPNGFANLYFTALANVPAGSPFFPAAFHDGGAPGFGLATEAASLAVEVLSQADGLAAGLQALQQAIEDHGKRLSDVGEQVASQTGFRFTGIDFSLAPFPEESSSLGTALERMGVPHTGQHGSLAAAAMLAATLDQADFPRIGFSGLLFPPLEDANLAQRAAENILTVKDLLMYSAVCGTGLDTIPLPGDTTPEELTPLLLDLAALALRLDKPLTARLMPVPGKQAGEPTTFDFDFFANSRVMPLSSAPLNAPMAKTNTIPILPRHKK